MYVNTCFPFFKFQYNFKRINACITFPDHGHVKYTIVKDKT